MSGRSADFGRKPDASRRHWPSGLGNHSEPCTQARRLRFQPACLREALREAVEERAPLRLVELASSHGKISWLLGCRTCDFISVFPTILIPHKPIHCTKRNNRGCQRKQLRSIDDGQIEDYQLAND